MAIAQLKCCFILVILCFYNISLSYSHFTGFSLEIVFIVLRFADLLLTIGSVAFIKFNKNMKELVDFSNYWPTSRHFSPIFTRFNFLSTWNKSNDLELSIYISPRWEHPLRTSPKNGYFWPPSPCPFQPDPLPQKGHPIIFQKRSYLTWYEYVF